MAHAPNMIVNDGDIKINITNPEKDQLFLEDIIELVWNTSGNFASNLLTYTIEYSIDGNNWFEIISDYGQITELNDSSNSHEFNLEENSEEIVYVRLQKNKTITSAEIKLEGLVE